MEMVGRTANAGAGRLEGSLGSWTGGFCFGEGVLDWAAASALVRESALVWTVACASWAFSLFSLSMSITQVSRWWLMISRGSSTNLGSLTRLASTRQR